MNLSLSKGSVGTACFPAQPTRAVRSSRIANAQAAMRPVIFFVFIFVFLSPGAKNSLLVFGMCTVFSDFLHGAAKSLCVVFVFFEAVFFRIKILCHRLSFVSAIAKSFFRYGIISRRAEGLTAKDSHGCEQHSHKKSALLKCLYCISRAGWRKTAGRPPLEGREILLVKTNKPNTQVLHSVTFSWNISNFANPRRKSLSTSVDLISRIPSLGEITIKYPVLSSGSTAR